MKPIDWHYDRNQERDLSDEDGVAKRFADAATALIADEAKAGDAGGTDVVMAARAVRHPLQRLRAHRTDAIVHCVLSLDSAGLCLSLEPGRGLGITHIRSDQIRSVTLLFRKLLRKANNNACHCLYLLYKSVLFLSFLNRIAKCRFIFYEHRF